MIVSDSACIWEECKTGAREVVKRLRDAVMAEIGCRLSPGRLVTGMIVVTTITVALALS